MLRKIIYRESLEMSQENVYDGVYFSKVTRLQCADCNFNVKRLHRRLFLKFVPKTSSFKKEHFQKKIYGGSTF